MLRAETPPDVVTTLLNPAKAAHADTDVKAKLEALGLEVSGETGPEFAAEYQETGRALGPPGQGRRVQGRWPMTAMQERRNGPDVAGGGCLLRLGGRRRGLNRSELQQCQVRGKAAGCDNSCRLRFETENAAELPVVQPTKFELVITCRPETVPARLLTRDDEVVGWPEESGSTCKAGQPARLVPAYLLWFFSNSNVRLAQARAVAAAQRFERFATELLAGVFLIRPEKP